MKTRNEFRFTFIFSALILIGLFSSTAPAQRARTIGADENAQQKSKAPAAPTQAPAPPSLKAKYEGGVFGYNKKVDGTLNFDDVNRRLLFRDKQGREIVSIAYDAVVSAFADTQSRRPTAAGVIGSASLYTLPALLIRKKYRYLTMQYKDPDTQVNGTTSFKIDDKNLLASALNTLADKSALTQRGEVFIKRKEGAMTTTTP